MQANDGIENTAFTFLRDSGRHGREDKHLRRNGNTPYTSGYDGIVSMLIPHATASMQAAVTYADFGWSANAVIALARKVAVPYVLFYFRRNGIYGIYISPMARKCCTCRYYFFIRLVHMLPSGTCYLPCEGTSRLQDGIGFHPEHIRNLPFRAGCERVFPTCSAQTYRMPCG